MHVYKCDGLDDCEHLNISVPRIPLILSREGHKTNFPPLSFLWYHWRISMPLPSHPTWVYSWCNKNQSVINYNNYMERQESPSLSPLHPRHFPYPFVVTILGVTTAADDEPSPVPLRPVPALQDKRRSQKGKKGALLLFLLWPEPILLLTHCYLNFPLILSHFLARLRYLSLLPHHFHY